jgi:hypothetical protein
MFHFIGGILFGFLAYALWCGARYVIPEMIEERRRERDRRRLS